MAVNKDIIKRCIIDKREEILSVEVVERPFQFEAKANYVFVGLRRVGKSYMLYQRVRQLLAAGTKITDILFVNFEDERLSELTANDLNAVLEAHYEMSGSGIKPVLFFDEIQNIEHWDKFVRRLADAKYTIYVTGSNAKMLSNDVATTLGGRFLIHNVYPYTFAEYLRANHTELPENWMYSTIEKSRVAGMFNSYFKFGGLPETVYFTNKQSVTQSLYQKIYLGDICARNNIRNSKVMGLVVRKLAESVKQPTSYNRIQNIIKSIGYSATVTTVSEYINYAVEAWLVLPIENGLAKMSERESVKKYYFIDNGILNLFLFDSDTALLENMVAVALCRKYGRENVTFLKSNIEIDFYVEQENLAIQVSYSIADFDTRERETRSLYDFAKKHNDAKLLIITKEETEAIANGDTVITVIPILEWLETL